MKTVSPGHSERFAALRSSGSLGRAQKNRANKLMKTANLQQDQTFAWRNTQDGKKVAKKSAGRVLKAGIL